ncbi:MAG: tetratricopeptide repeat protein, partial [Nostoc sp.]
MSSEIPADQDKVWFNLGLELLNKRCFDDALEAFEQANELKPGNY